MRAGMPVEFGHTNGLENKVNHSEYSEGTAMLLRRGNPTSSLEEDGLSSRDGGSVVAGVIMVDDRFVVNRGMDCKPVVLGSVLLNRRQPLDSIKSEELRKLILTQVPSLPGNFCFLTKDGWPVHKDQEKLVHIDQVVTDKNAIIIRKVFEKTRFGVMTSSGDCLGFIFIEMNASLRQVRDSIDEQLKDDKPLKTEYKFLERHGWPVTRQQESLLIVADILVNCNLHIHLTATTMVSPSYNSCTAIVPTRNLGPGRRLSPVGHTLSLPLRPPDEPDRPLIIEEIGKPKKKSRYTIRFDPRSKEVQSDTASRTKQNLVAKPILISYVRAEAAEHALIMKEELSSMGFSVYLDVHEIKMGSDWQDALNFAVSNCEVFLPLITPMYGKTLWTNREVKLADVLSKFIIPINFLDQWPPECLAIQFASTQYIPWKIIESDHVKGLEGDRSIPFPTGDYRHWERKHIKQVSEEIASRFLLMSKGNLIENKPQLRDPSKAQYRDNNNMSMYSAVRFSMLRSSRTRMPSDPDELQSMKDELDGRNRLVIISAHPRQLIFADRLKKLLEENHYEVWCSTEVLEDNLDVDSLGPINSGQLTPIPEGKTLQRSDKKLVRTVSEAASEKKALVRLSSQMSQMSVASDSLTPNKIAQLRKFQLKADQAGVVIIVVSEAYTKSTTSQQQVFYCEHRLQSVLVKVDNHHVPTLFSQLMGNDMLTTVDSPQFECALKAKVKRAMDPASSETPKDANMESKMQYLVKFMKKNLPMIDSCVYISGSSRLLGDRSKEICLEIGKALSKVRNLSVVTGGFYGAGDIVAKAFEEGLTQSPRSWEDPGPIVHILPFKDPKDFSAKARQNEEGSFESVPYGKNLFVGDSVKEREAVVARLFDICIVVEGGPGAAHEVEEFIWNDHFVIPIISTGGAAGGQFGVPLKILETPPCVSQEDWSILSEKEASAKTVADAVVRIVVALKQAIATHATVEALQAKRGKQAAAKAAKANKKRSKRSKRLVAQQQMQQHEQYTQMNSSASDLRMIKSVSLEQHEMLVDYNESDTSCTGHTNNSRWHKFITYLRPHRIPRT